MKYYDTYNPRPRHRSGCLGGIIWFFVKLLLRLMILCFIALAILYVLPTHWLDIQSSDDIYVNSSLPSEPYNVLLLGLDKASDDMQRSDTMIIATVDRTSMKLTSLLRDTVVEISGHGSKKLNAAYAYGGAALTMDTINRTYDLNITKYVAVNFLTMARLIDDIGGIECDITEEEMKAINSNNGDNYARFGYSSMNELTLTTYGENTHLNGAQALGFARIRALDSDFMRTSRQRRVIAAAIKKAKKCWMNPLVIYRLIRDLPDCIRTNMSVIELISIGEKVLFAQDYDTLRLPVDGSYVDDGSKLNLNDSSMCHSAFVQFAYN